MAQGHSIRIIVPELLMCKELTLELMEVFAPIVHGTYRRNVEGIRDHGLCPGGGRNAFWTTPRKWLHFIPTGIRGSGSHGIPFAPDFIQNVPPNRDVMVALNHKKWLAEGNKIWMSSNGLYMIDECIGMRFLILFYSNQWNPSINRTSLATYMR